MYRHDSLKLINSLALYPRQPEPRLQTRLVDLVGLTLDFVGGKKSSARLNSFGTSSIQHVTLFKIYIVKSLHPLLSLDGQLQPIGLSQITSVNMNLSPLISTGFYPTAPLELTGFLASSPNIIIARHVICERH